MSKAVNSPTARLLQSSRLFSLPRPLPQPSRESATSTGVFRASDTATTPYPTYQAIATPASSLSRGDWGLKRPLPGKTTRNTSTPHLRIRAQDNPEHITDFASAADHTQSAAKWLEMGIPMLLPSETKGATRRENRDGPTSVFESHLDNTDPDAANAESSSQETRNDKRVAGRAVTSEGPPPRQKWKYTGPWIGGMQEGEFNQYLLRTIEQRKSHWLSFLRTCEVQRKLQEAKQQARNEGNTLTPEEISQLQTDLLPTDADLLTIQKRLRDDHATHKLYSELTALICNFLDLPAAYSKDDQSYSPYASDRLNHHLNIMTPESGPPSTHSSAGLSHLRSNAIMENHPLYGPQAHRAPVLARVVRPRTTQAGANEYLAKLGVGGFVARDSISATGDPHQVTASAGRQPDPNVADPRLMSQALDPDLVGGNKMWVHPESAYVDEKGRIRLAISRGQNEAIAVKVGDVEHIHEAKRASRNDNGTGPAAAAMPVMPSQSRTGFSPRARQRQTWAGVPARGNPHRLPGVSGFDEELGRRPQQGQMERRRQADQIREILGRGDERSR